MKNKKQISILTILLIATSLIGAIQTANAEQTLFYDGSATTGWTSSVLSVGWNDGWGLNFMGPGAQYLDIWQVYIRNMSTMTGNVRAYLYNATDLTNPLNGYAPLDTSDAIDLFTTCDGGYYNWLDFEFGADVELEDDTPYSLVLMLNGSVPVGFNVAYYVTVGNEGVRHSGSYAGNLTYGKYSTNHRATCRIYTQTVAEEGGEIPDAPSDTTMDDLVTALTNFAVPLIVMMVPVGVFWLLGGRGKWPLLIGITVGTGLGYTFIPGFPVWLVFLVAIGIIGMAYSDIRSGNGMT